jgi:hypothetical protein
MSQKAKLFERKAPRLLPGRLRPELGPWMEAAERNQQSLTASWGK